MVNLKETDESNMMAEGASRGVKGLKSQQPHSSVWSELLLDWVLARQQ